MKLQENVIKVPIVLRAFCFRILEQYTTTEVEHILIANIVISGKSKYSI